MLIAMLKERRKKKMGKFFGWFQKDDVAELKKDREALVKKAADIEEEIKAIDERIAKIEAENEGND